MMIKSNLKFILFVFCADVLVSCSNDYYKKPAPKPVDYTVIQKSPLFNKKNISFSLDSLNNELFIKLTIKELKDFPFPINKQYNDTLTKTAFTFNMYFNNKIIQSDYHLLKNTFKYLHDSSSTARNLSFSTDTVDLKGTNELRVKIPFYAFHELKKGKQTVELTMSQTLFTDDKSIMNKDSAYHTVHLYAGKSLLNTRVKFNIVIPTIFKNIVYGQGLILKNDATFSPASMDVTLFKSSYPDIYWTIFYPKNEFYVQTPYETSTDRYIAHDTFNLYHYYQNDSIGFGVYDHDNLSRDDGMGYWWGSLNELTKTPIKRIAFGNIKSFDIKVKEIGVVN
jgi:hypothetical protein